MGSLFSWRPQIASASETKLMLRRMTIQLQAIGSISSLARPPRAAAPDRLIAAAGLDFRSGEGRLDRVP